MFVFLLGALALALPALSQPAPPAPFAPADKAEVEKVINDYFQAFTDKNYDRVRDSFQAPFVNLSGGGSVVISTLDDAVGNYRRIRESLEGSGYAASKAVEIRITALANNGVIANIHWQRLKKDGSLLNEGSEFMIVTRESGRWKICSSIGQNLADFGKQY
jgi:hypothetical protein